MRNSTAIWILLFLLVCGLIWNWAGSDQARTISNSNRAVGHGKKVAAVLINNDITDLHCGNMQAALQACKRYDFDEILSFGDNNPVPSVAEIVEGLQELQRREISIGLFYLTGHGSLYHSSEIAQGESCIMLTDDPLRVGDLIPWLGQGPCLIYTDVCYAPGLLEGLKTRLQGDFLLLSDKPSSSPERSCRGISTRFWKGMEEGTTFDSLWEQSLKVWNQTSPDGVSLRISSSPVSLSNDFSQLESRKGWTTNDERSYHECTIEEQG